MWIFLSGYENEILLCFYCLCISPCKLFFQVVLQLGVFLRCVYSLTTDFPLLFNYLFYIFMLFLEVKENMFAHIPCWIKINRHFFVTTECACVQWPLVNWSGICCSAVEDQPQWPWRDAVEFHTCVQPPRLVISESPSYDTFSICLFIGVNGNSS